MSTFAFKTKKLNLPLSVVMNTNVFKTFIISHGIYKDVYICIHIKNKPSP